MRAPQTILKDFAAFFKELKASLGNYIEESKNVPLHLAAENSVVPKKWPTMAETHFKRLNPEPLGVLVTQHQ